MLITHTSSYLMSTIVFLWNISAYSENCAIPRQEVGKLEGVFMDIEMTDWSRDVSSYIQIRKGIVVQTERASAKENVVAAKISGKFVHSYFYITSKRAVRKFANWLRENLYKKAVPWCRIQMIQITFRPLISLCLRSLALLNTSVRIYFETQTLLASCKFRGA